MAPRTSGGDGRVLRQPGAMGRGPGRRRCGFGMFGGAPDSPLMDTIRRAPRLRWVHQGSAGGDGVPLEAFPPQVVVTSGKGPMAVSVAEHAVSMMLALARHLPEAVRDQQA